jgi:hypothetical protein
MTMELRKIALEQEMIQYTDIIIRLLSLCQNVEPVENIVNMQITGL